jgi:hypothetical protein
VERAEKFEITAEGEGAKEMPKDASNYLVVGCKAAFEASGKPLPVLKYHVVSRIPYARGLGSSSAAIVAGIVAGLVLAGHRLPCWGSEALLQVAAGIEVRPSSMRPTFRKSLAQLIYLSFALFPAHIYFFTTTKIGSPRQRCSCHLRRRSNRYSQWHSLDDRKDPLSSRSADGHVYP